MKPQDDYSELLKLCRDIFPKTWNVFEYCDLKSIRKERGILNIELHRYDADKLKEYNAFRRENKLKRTIGHVKPILYIDGVGQVKISLHCDQPFQEPYVLLHELAHVAVFRLQSLITKSYKKNGFAVDGLIESKSLYHGKVFKRMLSILRERAIRAGWTIFEKTKVKGVKGGGFRFLL